MARHHLARRYRGRGEAPDRDQPRTSRSRTPACAAPIPIGSRARASAGMEYNAWGEPKNPPEHEANLVFTRMLSGPMDFTPGIVSLKGRERQRRSPRPWPSSSRFTSRSIRRSRWPPTCPKITSQCPGRSSSSGRADRLGRDARARRRDRRLCHDRRARQRGRDDWYLGAVGDEEARTLRPCRSTSSTPGQAATRARNLSRRRRLPITAPKHARDRDRTPHRDSAER